MDGPEWWTHIKRVAFGPLSLKPGEFWSLSPAEILEMYEAKLWWIDEEFKMKQRLTAWHAAIVVNHKDAKRPRLTVEKLVGDLDNKAERKTKKRPKRASEVLSGMDRTYRGRWGEDGADR
ncbi:hypothetical protein HMPREF9374_1110 [Desmospora sp. 8437]|nr:hypothetical protein HMPREF9374_1110 [Desmospora sp. 8437]